MYLTAAKTFVPFLFALALALPAQGMTQVEGRVNGSSRQSGIYDLLIQVWDNPGADGKAKLLQTIQIAKVPVVNGSFSIAFDANFLGGKESDFSFQVQSRPFEAWKPFQPGEVSRVRLDEVVPKLVVR